MKKKIKLASRKPSKAKPRVVKRATRPRPDSADRAAAQAAASRDELAGGLAQLITISADMREILREIRDLLAEGTEEAQAEEQEAGEGASTVIIAESEGEEFD
jgi:hypothetical protein